MPTYVLTDNEKTVTVEHIAGIPVRNPQLVGFAEHYSVVVHTCVPADPASKGGTEAAVKISKADLVPKETNLLEEYATFAELEAACEAFCEKVNTRPHRVTKRPPVEMLAEERVRLHPVAARPHTSRSGPPGWCRATRRWWSSSPASTRSRTRCSGRRCGCAPKVSAPTSRS